MNHRLTLASAATLLSSAFLLAGSADATPINGNPTTGLSSPSSTILFSEIVLPNNTVLGTQYLPRGIASFSGFFYNGCPTGCITTPPTGIKPDITNFANDNAGNPFNAIDDIVFSNAQNGAAFQFASNGGTFTFTALLNGLQVEQFTGNGLNYGYYGFANIALNEIRISAPSQMLIDNLQLGSGLPNAVPVPAPIALLGLGLFAMGFGRRFLR